MRILAISPHPDDAEFGCGATLCKYTKSGHIVHNLIFFDDFILKTEAERASRKIGTLPIFIYMVGRHYNEHRQEILQIMYDINQECVPDIVFIPSTTDVHQDHKVITEEAIRAFKESTVLGYNQPWNQTFITTNYFVPIESNETEAKLSALSQYHSRLHLPYFDKEYQLSILRGNGMKIRTNESEAFETIRVIERKI